MASPWWLSQATIPSSESQQVEDAALSGKKALATTVIPILGFLLNRFFC
jgi:hypothetical protein